MKKALFCLAVASSTMPAFAALEGFESKLTFNLNAVQAESNTFNVRAIIETERKTPLNTLSGRLRYSYSEQRVGGLSDVTTDNWLAQALYEQVMTSRLDWYVSGTLERDRIAELDLRQIYTGGLAYKLRTTDTMSWKVRAGAGLIDENYRFTDDRSDFTLEFGSDYRNKISSNTTVSHLLRLVPTPQDLGDFYLQSDLGIDYAFNDRMSGAFRFLLDYDKTPAPGFRKDRIEWVIGIGYKF